jgi:hypothetical protein
MSTASQAPRDVEAYDVYISYPREERGWAERLARDLRAFGLRCFIDLDQVSVSESWRDALNRALGQSSAIVVLWSPAAARSEAMALEIEAVEDLLAGQPDVETLVVPVILGGEGVGDVPPQLSSRISVMIGREAYSAGPEAESEEWTRAVEQIAQAVSRLSRPPDEERRSTTFSPGALRALTNAATMLGDDGGDAARLRTAALLGALHESAQHGMTPTTGEVVKLILSRGSGERPAAVILDAAAAAAGLVSLGSSPPKRMGAPELRETPASPLLDEAVELERRTASGGVVHLRHILATGVHPAVPGEVLAQLGVTMDEIREQWRESIALTWPSESQEGWDEILFRPAADGGAAGAPPSARVHADRWTTEDRLDYALYAKAIAEFIRHPDAKPPMVISVQAPWGQGKTSLMRMVQSDLDPHHPDLGDPEPDEAEEEMEKPASKVTFGDLRRSLDGAMEMSETKPSDIRTVWFNAWKYQNSEQIWAGLAHAILAQLPARLSRKDRELFWLRLQLRRIDPTAVRNDIHRAALERFLPRLAGWAMLLLGIVVVAGLTALAGGLDALGAGVAGAGVLGTAAVARAAWTTATKEVLKRPLEGAYIRYIQQPDYAGKLGYLHLVEEDMKRALELLTPDNQPAVIFIDDLDRCSPAKVGEVIEAVNLFLAGDYPNCAFVIGIDAEVVAASMEVVHAEIINKLGDRRGELGWRFMDKFVQLPFVIPRLHPDQREAYLRGLFATPQDEDTQEVLEEADQLASDAQAGDMEVDDLARRVGELAPRLAAVSPDKARALGERVVTAGARAFSDNDPEVVQALADQMRYLSDNPRTIKRAVNLYRFHRFAAFARQASTLPLEVATPEQIGRWIVVIIRWPHFVRWLQAQRDEAAPQGEDAAARVLVLAGETDSPVLFESKLADQGITASWTNDAELWEFLRDQAHPELQLDLAGPRGLW